MVGGFATLSIMTDDVKAPPAAVPVVAVVGATAAGKTALSLDLAEALGGEVVNTDAMQVYRGMDIGTAKLGEDERRGIRHHLLDLLDVTEPATVAEFQRLARDVLDDCRRRGVAPVLVGGSALYTRAILDRFEFPGTDQEVRAGLEVELERLGAPALHGRLAATDADAAQESPDGPANAEPPDGEIHARTQTEQANEELQEENAGSALDQPSDGSGGE